MEKVYRLLPWLSMDQAIDYLELLTKTPCTGDILIQLCDAKQCAVYADCEDIDGNTVGTGEPVTGLGYCKIKYPWNSVRHGVIRCVIGEVFDQDISIKDNCEWIPCQNSSPSIAFKSSDIEALAAKMNGESKPEAKAGSTIEAIESHHQSLNSLLWKHMKESEREAMLRLLDESNPAAAAMLREALERAERAEARAHRATPQQLGTIGANDLSTQLEQERTARKYAEVEAAKLRQELKASIENSLLHEQESAAKLAEFEQAIAELKIQKHANTKPSHLLAIAALLELLKEPVEFPRLQGRKQAAIKDEILHKFPWRGLSKRSLEDIFSAANKAKADTE